MTSTVVLPPTSLLARLDRPGPRYTSYPTADRFDTSFGPDDHRRALRARADGHRVGGATPLSVYVHVPFCESVCYYCACNKVVTRHHERAAPYLDALEREIALVTDELGRGQAVSQLHLGGGSPTFLSDGELTRLMTAIRGAFSVRPDAEVSIEVDPRTVDEGRLAHLAALGFERLSFGVQDFDPDVQRAVHREQPFAAVEALMGSARRLGFGSINVDLIYGLPHQTPETFTRTLGQVGSLGPDRIALYAYAHLPARFKPQRRIVAAELPTAAARIEMLGSAMASFLGRGYAYIGMDHFARHDDALAVAQRQGRLHRNFQGYSTQPDCDLIGLGPSAIGRMGATYSQNAKSLDDWQAALDDGRFPIERGRALTRDDLVRRAVIMALMCQGRVDFEAIELAHLVSPREYFAAELDALQPFVDDGLVEVGRDGVDVTAAGWFFVRGVAMVFDAYLQRQGEAGRERFSRIV